MKKILLILMLLLSFSGFAQNNSYPKYITDGDTLRVVFTIEQAQKIDNDLELLSMYKNASVNYDSVSNAYILVIDNMNNQIATLKLALNTSEVINENNTSLIRNLKGQITNYEQDLILAKQQSDNKDIIITNQKKEIKKQKTQKIIGFISAVGIAVGLIILLR